MNYFVCPILKLLIVGKKKRKMTIEKYNKVVFHRTKYTLVISNHSWKKEKKMTIGKYNKVAFHRTK